MGYSEQYSRLVRLQQKAKKSGLFHLDLIKKMVVGPGYDSGRNEFHMFHNLSTDEIENIEFDLRIFDLDLDLFASFEELHVRVPSHVLNNAFFSYFPNVHTLYTFNVLEISDNSLNLPKLKLLVTKGIKLNYESRLFLKSVPNLEYLIVDRLPSGYTQDMIPPESRLPFNQIEYLDEDQNLNRLDTAEIHEILELEKYPNLKEFWFRNENIILSTD